jgi:nucleoside-diphosphate-sugar epimerase
MKIAVIGATGYIGSAVTAALCERSHAVRAVLRSAPDSSRAPLPSCALPVQGDLREPDALALAVSDCDAIVWTATANDEATDRRAVSAVLARIAGTGKAFVYTSGVWVHGNTGAQAGSEDSPVTPAALVKWRPALEQEVLSAPGVRGVVIRPAIVHGGNGGILASMAQDALRRGAVRHVGDGLNRWPLVHRDDLASLFALALERASAGAVFVAAHEAVQVQEIARAIGHRYGLGGRIASWPLHEARQEWGDFADALCLDQEFTSARARQLLGWVPRSKGIREEFAAPATAATGI